jgi:hypothetical protein
MFGLSRQVPMAMSTRLAITPFMDFTWSISWPAAMKRPPSTMVRLAPRNRSAICPPFRLKR